MFFCSFSISNMNNMKYLSLLLLFPLLVYGQDFQPKPNQGDLITHSHYSLSYIEQHEQAEWVYYILTSAMASGPIERTDNFRSDPAVSTYSASKKDYLRTGYDRGHLAPAGDMTINTTAMSESFFMSNMSPQLPGLNRGAWKSLEALMRGWTLDNEKLYVVTGPIFESNLGSIGENKVTIPGYYYKIAFSKDAEKMIGFILPNQKVSGSLASFAVSIDEIEARTGIDFYYQLDDTIEDRLESATNPDLWNFSIKKVQKRSINGAAPTSSQCLGLATSTGNRCKNSTKSKNGYCSRHQAQVIGK